jgi:hypothetical protein|tara:strand:- start:4189 stop:4572 length:384 start_codon:yes stop_codon:yes gene_type:complete
MSFETFLYAHPSFAKFVITLLLLFSDLCAYSYTLLKVYRVLLFSKVTFDQLPLLNPYVWPLSFFRVVTNPYFRFWFKLLPNLRFGRVSYDISTIFGLEVLGTFIYLSMQLRAASFIQAQEILTHLNQ